MDRDLPVLTVRQPWADLIVHGCKTVENRTWRPKLAPGDTLLIHASSRVDRDTIAMADELTAGWTDHARHLVDEWVYRRHGDATGGRLGAILGAVTFDGVIPAAEWWSPPRPWGRVGHRWWRLANAHLLDEPIPAVGRLQLWKHPAPDPSRFVKATLL